MFFGDYVGCLKDKDILTDEFFRINAVENIWPDECREKMEQCCNKIVAKSFESAILRSLHYNTEVANLISGAETTRKEFYRLVELFVKLRGNYVDIEEIINKFDAEHAKVVTAPGKSTCRNSNRQ